VDKLVLKAPRGTFAEILLSYYHNPAFYETLRKTMRNISNFLLHYLHKQNCNNEVVHSASPLAKFCNTNKLHNASCVLQDQATERCLCSAIRTSFTTLAVFYKNKLQNASCVLQEQATER
jgi:hypothetical protein